MMARAKWGPLLFLTAACASPITGSGTAGAQGKEPFEIVRSIAAVQDRFVVGDAGAKANLQKLLDQLAGDLLTADREAWRDTRNAHAAVLYTLSGGSPRVIRTVISLGLSPEADLQLMRGALAYVEGRLSEARRVLSPIDAMTLPPLTGATVALVQSALIAPADPRRAIRLLDRARILAPGTLIEETAMRRELALADATADIDKFQALSANYIWRFPHSVYFESFRQRFPDSVVHLSLAIAPAEFDKIEKVIGAADPASRLDLYLRIARRGVIEGKAVVASLAASKAVQVSAAGSVERARATLYEGAALVLTDRFESGMGEIKGVDTARLPKADAGLKEAILALAESISDNSGERPQSAAPGSIEGSARHLTASASALIELARESLAQTAEVLERKLP